VLDCIYALLVDFLEVVENARIGFVNPVRIILLGVFTFTTLNKFRFHDVVASSLLVSSNGVNRRSPVRSGSLAFFPSGRPITQIKNKITVMIMSSQQKVASNEK